MSVKEHSKWLLKIFVINIVDAQILIYNTRKWETMGLDAEWAIPPCLTMTYKLLSSSPSWSFFFFCFSFVVVPPLSFRAPKGLYLSPPVLSQNKPVIITGGMVTTWVVGVALNGGNLLPWPHYWHCGGCFSSWVTLVIHHKLFEVMGHMGM